MLIPARWVGIIAGKGQTEKTRGTRKERASARIVLLQKVRRLHQAWVLGVAGTHTGSKCTALACSRVYSYVK